jgi:HK97 gp10 family phage protein
MIETSIDFSALNSIARDLEMLSKAENNKVLRDATRAGAQVIREEVIAKAPVKTGKTRKNVVVVTQKSRRRGEISSGVHIRGVNPLTGNSDTSMRASDPKNAFYWRFVELGTVNAPAHPFVRPAYDAREAEAAQAVINQANAAIDKVLTK